MDPIMNECTLDIEMLCRPKPNRLILWIRKLLWLDNKEFDAPSLFTATLLVKAKTTNAPPHFPGSPVHGGAHVPS